MIYFSSASTVLNYLWAFLRKRKEEAAKTTCFRARDKPCLRKMKSPNKNRRTGAHSLYHAPLMHNIPTNFPAATVSPPHRELEKKARQQKPHTEQAPAREYRLNSGLYPAHMDVITSILPIFFHILCPFSPGPPPMCPPETRRQKERQLDVNSVTGVRPDHPSRTQLITVNSRLFLVCLFFSLGRALPSTICCLFLFCYRVFHAPLHFPCPNLRSTSTRAEGKRPAPTCIASMVLGLFGV